MKAVAQDLTADLARLEELARSRARELLEAGTVRLVLGHRQAWTGPTAVPHFVTTPEAAGLLVTGPGCAAGIAKYVLDEQDKEGKVAVLARGCDTLGIRRMIVDKRVDPEKVLVIGLPCAGSIDPAKVANAVGADAAAIARVTPRDGRVEVLLHGQKEPVGGPPLDGILRDVCLACDQKVPSGCAEVLGADLAVLAEVSARPPVLDAGDAEAEVTRIESLSPGERYAYWADVFSRCLRCFACRNACPACNCRVCTLESYDPKWLGHPTDMPNQFMFHFIRAMDVAGRCVGCGECERVCPAGLPLMSLNRKLSRDIRLLFGVERPHVPGDVEPLGRFEPEDPEEFM